MRKMALVLMLAMLLTALVPAAAEGSINMGGTVYEGFELMEESVRIGDYEAAKEYLEEFNLVGYNIPLAREYQLYIDAMLAMEAGRYEDAASTFEGLAVAEPPFLDSAVVFNYCSGRVKEAAENYQDAVDFYTAAIAFEDANERKQNCIRLAQEQRVAQAQSLYQRGQAQGDIALLEQAMERYSALNDTQMVQACQAEIERVNKQNDYAEATAIYQRAMADNDVVALRTAAAVFTALGDFEDSAALAASIEEHIRMLERELTLVSATPATNAIVLVWTDNAATGGQYEITYAPENSNAPLTVSAAALEYTLENLIPDTTYTISIMPEGAEQNVVRTTVKTLRAANFEAEGFYIRHANAFSLRRSYYSRQNKSLAGILTDTPRAVSFPENNVLAMEDITATLQGNVYGYYMTYIMDAATEDAVTVQWILRTKDSGVYVGEATEQNGLPQTGTIVCELDALLDALYADQQEWPTAPCTLELYLNNSFAGRGTFTLAE